MKFLILIIVFFTSASLLRTFKVTVKNFEVTKENLSKDIIEPIRIVKKLGKELPINPKLISHNQKPLKQILILK